MCYVKKQRILVGSLLSQEYISVLIYTSSSKSTLFRCYTDRVGRGYIYTRTPITYNWVLIHDQYLGTPF